MSLRCDASEVASLLGCDAATAQRLASYTEVLDRWQRAQRLVGWRSADGLLREGLHDAWEAHQALADAGAQCVVDLGSGAGLPGVVLAASAPARMHHLVELRRKRAAFLQEVVRKLRLDNCRVHHDDANRVVGSLAPAPDTLTARAFEAPDAVLQRASAWGVQRVLLSSSRRRLSEGGWPGGVVRDRAGWGLHVERPGRPQGTGRLHLVYVAA